MLRAALHAWERLDLAAAGRRRVCSSCPPRKLPISLSLRLTVQEDVFKRWSKTEEGKKEAKEVAKQREKRAGRKNNDLLDALSNLVS